MLTSAYRNYYEDRVPSAMNFLPSHAWTVQKLSMHSFIVLVANSVSGSPRPTGHAEMICNRSFMMSSK
jgi:hypothetical protein